MITDMIMTIEFILLTILTMAALLRIDVLITMHM